MKSYISVKGTLWVNPFLDKFYIWGKGTWWSSKRQFIGYLDTGLPEVGYDAISTYITENVPEWYYQSNKYLGGKPPQLIMSINAFHGNSNNLNKFIGAWENNEPYMTDVDFWPTAWFSTSMRDSPQGYKDYPEYLKWNGNVLPSHEYYGSYVRLLEFGGFNYNSIFFTTKRNVSWCNTLPVYNFLNWNKRNPMEVKE